MALSGKVETEIEIQTPAAKFFNLFIKQLHQVQNICTERIHKTKVHEGDWHSIGSIRHWTYTVGDHCKGKLSRNRRSKQVIDIDEDVGKQYKTLKAKLKVSDKNNGGAVAKWVYEYEKLNQNVPTPNGYLDLITKITKDVDAHLTAA